MVLLYRTNILHNVDIVTSGTSFGIEMDDAVPFIFREFLQLHDSSSSNFFYFFDQQVQVSHETLEDWITVL